MLTLFNSPGPLNYIYNLFASIYGILCLFVSTTFQKSSLGIIVRGRLSALASALSFKMLSSSSTSPASPSSPPQPQPQPSTTDHHHHTLPRTTSSRPLSSSSTTSSDYSNFSLPSSPRTATNAVDTHPTPSPSAKSNTNIGNSYYNKSYATNAALPATTAIPTTSAEATTTTTAGFTISDDDITFDGQPLSALYEMTRYRYVHVQCGEEDQRSQRSRVEERGRRRVR